MIDYLPPPPIVEPAAIIEPMQQWYIGETIRIAFVGGDPEMHARIMAIEAGPDGWSSAIGGLVIVFVDDPMQADVRVSFDPPQSWSVLGRGVTRVPAPAPTMNLGTAPHLDDAGLRHIWLHEFGHTLGLQHEPPDGDRLSVMQTYPSSSFGQVLSAEDRRTVAEWYGPPLRPTPRLWLPMVGS